MRVWLDDERPCPPDYDLHVKNSNYMYDVLRHMCVTEISFDHDMGDGKPTGYDIAKYLEEKYANGEMDLLIKFRVHSFNPIGRDNIKAAIKKCEEHWYSKKGDL